MRRLVRARMMKRPDLCSCNARLQPSSGDSPPSSERSFAGNGAPLGAFDRAANTFGLVDDAHDGASSPGEGYCMEMGSFDHYARLVKRLLRVPASLVSIVEESGRSSREPRGWWEPS